ncbi:MAG TPA: divalent metal cation transporter [Candidatus Udaeobacter sp.]|jgi:NRAMP (natural resistance-associated macrophage protein)-like metal ion transporter|nr:divalent metal cation transporter [Candidatus Udaeobacter sp.]
MAKTDPSKKPNPVRRFFSLLGPGLITGAADDDPSGVATYTITGAQLGTSLLWTAFITWPLMGCVQFMCARIGMVTGLGLAGALRRKIPRWMLIVAALALFGANSINVGADLSGMADAAEMLTGINSHLLVIIFGVGIAFWAVRCRYYQIAMILKWLALCLFAYVITAFVVRPDWGAIARDTFVPTWPKDHDTWQNLVAILGTTISPYLFFWQSSQEVEHEKSMGRRMLVQREGATKREIIDRKLDVGIGTFFSNLVMYFIILTAAVTLHQNGVTQIETSKQAAEALRPLAGSLAYFLYTAGLIGVGLLAIPTLAGSAAYAFAETFKWREGLDLPFKSAQPFYIVLIVSTLFGIAMDFLNINPVKALFWTAVINGVLAPFLLVGILMVASDGQLMRRQPSSWLSLAGVGVITLVMFGAAAAMFVL